MQLLDRVPSPTLGELGSNLGLSPFHIQRLFKGATGLTPRQYVATRRLDRVRAGLKGGARVTDALYDAGYGSSRALYDVADKQLAMRPGTYRVRGRGERIAYALVETSLGTMLVAATDRGICSLRFGERDDLVQQVTAEFAESELMHDPAAVSRYTEAILEYLDGRQTTLDMPTNVHPTVFQQQVWEALGRIPYGETRTYKEVAAMISRPNAVRAVARACASNPLALVVPCHRVVRSTGEPGGYRWGPDRKRALLKSEKGGQ
jgi:AraC family transcriptional regulator of adaptative response/methylated-DNA-[protein]-cysteine methyltransferase